MGKKFQMRDVVIDYSDARKSIDSNNSDSYSMKTRNKNNTRLDKKIVRSFEDKSYL